MPSLGEIAKPEDHLDVFAFSIPRAGQFVNPVLQSPNFFVVTPLNKCVGASAHLMCFVALAVGGLNPRSRQ